MSDSRFGRAGRSAIGLWLGAAAALQFAHALEASLGRLHAPSAASAGFGQLTDGGGVDRAWEIWSAGLASLGGPFDLWTPTALVFAHTVVEVLAAVLLFAALVAMQRPRRARALVARPWGRFAVGALTLSVLVSLGEAGTAAVDGDARSTIATSNQVLSIGRTVAVVLTLAALLAPSANRTRLRRAAGYVYWSPAILRVLLVLDVVFVVVLYGGRIGSQSEDLMERWFDGHWEEGVATVVAYAAFVLVVRASAAFTPTKTRPSGRHLAVGGVVLTGLGLTIYLSDWAGHGAGLLVLGGGTLVVGLAELCVGGGDPPSGDVPEKSGRWLRGPVAALPGVALGLVLVRASANHLVTNGEWVAFALAGLVALGLAAGAWHVVNGPAPADDLRAATGPAPRTAGAKALGCAALAAGLMVVVTAWTPGIGALAILLTTLAGTAGLAVLARPLVSAGFPPRTFELLGFGRTPLITLFLAWVVVSTSINAVGNPTRSEWRVTHHDLAVIERDTRDPTPLPADAADIEAGCLAQLAALDAAGFCRWLGLETTEAPVGATSIPLVLATASGGGVRAAAWTETILDCLLLRDDPARCAGSEADDDRWGALYAAGGASGGSVGIASTLAERLVTEGRVHPDWRRDHLDGDALSPALARSVLHDLLLGGIGIFRGHDRTRALEEAWAERWLDGERDSAVYCSSTDPTSVAELGLLTLQELCARQVPLLLFNGTDVGTGRRVNIAPVYLADEDIHDDRAPFAVHRYLAADQDISLFTAAFLSARFPLLTPSARLPTCRAPSGARLARCPDPDQMDPDRRVLNVVDGGYAENSGAAQVHALWEQLQPVVDAWNATGTSPRVRVMLVEIENGELAGSSPPELAIGTSELFRPLQTIVNVYAGRADNSRAALRGRFAECSLDDPVADDRPQRVHLAMYEHPGRVLPLGWTLSDRSLDDIDSQLDVTRNDQARRCFAAWLQE